MWLLSYALIFCSYYSVEQNLGNIWGSSGSEFNNTIFWDVGPCSLVDRYQSTEHHSAEFHNFVGHKLLKV